MLGAVVGALLGLETLVLHLSTDPLVDIRRYYEAGRRLNEGLPLYGLVSEDTTATYLNPPLLAILFRPLALLPFPAAAAIWEMVVAGSLALTIWRAGLNRRVLIVVCWLALPICWALVIGQVEIIITLLLSFGTPAAVALAGTMKLFPWLAAAYWVGRRQWTALARFVAWIAGLFLLQLLIEPAGTLAFFRLEWLDASFEVRNVSLWVIHPALWLVGAVVAGVASLRLGRNSLGLARGRRVHGDGEPAAPRLPADRPARGAFGPRSSCAQRGCSRGEASGLRRPRRHPQPLPEDQGTKHDDHGVDRQRVRGRDRRDRDDRDREPWRGHTDDRHGDGDRQRRVGPCVRSQQDPGRDGPHERDRQARGEAARTPARQR